MVAAAVLVLLFTAGCSKLKARDQLNKGVQAYKAAKYDSAIEHFKNAVALDEKDAAHQPMARRRVESGPSSSRISARMRRSLSRRSSGVR